MFVLATHSPSLPRRVLARLTWISLPQHKTSCSTAQPACPVWATHSSCPGEAISIKQTSLPSHPASQARGSLFAFNDTVFKTICLTIPVVRLKRCSGSSKNHEQKKLWLSLGSFEKSSPSAAGEQGRNTPSERVQFRHQQKQCNVR